MKKTVLGVAMVVVFCITWWLVAGEAMQAVEPAKQAYEQALQARQKARQYYEPAKQPFEQAEQASIMADAHFRTQASWGIGAGLLADVLLLVGALAWQKITFKP